MSAPSDKKVSTSLEDESAVLAVAKEMARTVVDKVVDAATKPRKIVQVGLLLCVWMSTVTRITCCTGRPLSKFFSLVLRRFFFLWKG